MNSAHVHEPVDGVAGEARAHGEESPARTSAAVKSDGRVIAVIYEASAAITIR